MDINGLQVVILREQLCFHISIPWATIQSMVLHIIQQLEHLRCLHPYLQMKPLPMVEQRDLCILLQTITRQILPQTQVRVVLFRVDLAPTIILLLQAITKQTFSQMHLFRVAHLSMIHQNNLLCSIDPLAFLILVHLVLNMAQLKLVVQEIPKSILL